MELVTHESRSLPIGLLNEPENPSRSEMNDAKLDALVESIRANGVISHLIVFPVGERYEIRAGHRRYQAARRAGLAVVPCDVYPTGDAASEAVQFAENEYREKLSPADEAIWFDELLTKKCDGDVDKLCARLNLKRDRVERRLDLIYRGCPLVFESLQHGQIKVGVAEQINRCTDVEHRRYLLDLARHEEWTVARAAGAIDQWRLYHAPAKGTTNGATPSEPGPDPVNDYFQCFVCGSSDNPQSMKPRQVHDYCERATVKPAIEMYGRRTDYVRFPATLDDARALAGRLLDRFPELGPG
jgi:ParB/RepB/Spo0J family partition protein